MNRLVLILSSLLLAVSTWAGDIIVRPGESLHDALRQAREWRRTNDARCAGGINIVLQGGQHLMSEPLLIRPEDSGTATSPTIIRGTDGAILCGDIPQQHTQLFPKEGMERLISFDAARRTVTIPIPVLPVAIGLYLPLELSTPIMVGGIIKWIVDKKKGASEGDAGKRQRDRRDFPGT